MEELGKQQKGRKQGSKNKETKTLDQLLNDGENKGMMLSGFIIGNNRLRITIATEIGPTAALLYETILSHHNLKSDRCFPTIKVLHKESGISERKISEILGQLSSKGYLVILSGGRHFANQFFFPYEYFFKTFDAELISIYAEKTNQKELGYEELIDQIVNKQNYFQGKAYKEIVKKVDKIRSDSYDFDEDVDPF